MVSGETGDRLSKLIKKAIRDLVVTNEEYDEIMAEAAADGVVDSQETALLRQLHDMIANGTVKRIAADSD